MAEGGFAQWLYDHWPSVSLTIVATTGMGTIAATVFTGHSEQAGPILGFLTTLLGLLAILFKLQGAQAEIRNKVGSVQEQITTTDETKLRALTAVAQVTAQSSAKVDTALAKLDEIVKNKGNDGGPSK